METGRVRTICVLWLPLLFFPCNSTKCAGVVFFCVLCLCLFHHCIACVDDYTFASPFHVVTHDTRHVLRCVLG